MTMPEGRFADIGRLRVHYHRAGSGPVLVLLHGWPEFAGAWKKVLPVLADRYDTIAPDLRGFGQTEALTEDGRAPADAATARAACCSRRGIAADRRAGGGPHVVGLAARRARAAGMCVCARV